MVIMWFFYLYMLFILNPNFKYVNTHNNEIHVYMDNQTLCNQGMIDLKDVHTWKIYSHIYYHNKYLYFPDHHCSITIRTNKRVWMSMDSFQSNSSSSFPRCTEAKYAGIDDRLLIIDGYKNGSILRIICGKDTDKRFDRTPLILKSSIFTLDWQTKSQAVGFQLKFVAYDLSIDGKCLNLSQFHCKNKRCIDQSLICSNDDYCGDNSHRERVDQCSRSMSKQKLLNWPWMMSLMIFCCFSFVFISICVFKSVRNRGSNKGCRSAF